MSKVYIVLTIESRGTGRSFILERVFLNLKDAAIHKLNLEFKNNTEYFTKKDKTELEKEYNSIREYLDSCKLYSVDEFEIKSKIFVDLLDQFARNKIDRNEYDLPIFRTYINEMAIDTGENFGRKRYDHFNFLF